MAGVQVDPVAWACCAAGAAGYVVGVRRLAARRAHWPQGRSAAMVGAVVAVLVATSSPLAAGGAGAPARQAAADCLLVYLVPLLLARAAPHALAIEAGGRGTARRVRAATASPVARFLCAPPVALALVVGLQAAVGLTSLHALATTHPWVAEPLQVGLVVAGCAYLWPVFGLDPLPRRLGNVPALAHLLVLLPLSTLLGMAIESTASAPIIAAKGAVTAADAVGQSINSAGGIVWTVGSLGCIAAAIAVLLRWLRAEERAAPGRRAGLDEGAHAQLVAWQEARRAAAADDEARRAAYAARRR